MKGQKRRDERERESKQVRREMDDERIVFSRGEVIVTAGNVTWAVSFPRGR